MEKDGKLLQFINTKSDVIDNLKAIQEALSLSVNDGMVDLEDRLYNELLGLVDQASVSNSWEELEEVISKGKTLETDVDAFLNVHGQSTMSLPWPSIPKG
ncbi:MAG: hypothetical protein ACD_17C00297G0002 [uncultured bacterium]|nr:MAG: hypothetical protein ACD_17C00297G0002 [uncultured bacterium]OGN56834.1 MAG: hypothetical protein A3C42_02485 [Chlamydiae bacterium RIFCSPHIGHO2_02_FULL_45_9]OGN56857.1 MAG: hypothetical protein A2796_06700 [Chlamydiae bacterium RIFCSPHIGHO2_01_FULL_44_39]OGN59515.1 MAG: hypothetical protein A3D96_07390 [Chlamydiae bacterium RIFCSPHIGHO2_12_FULL_44_59]OGN67260.1 MAG: hypothetical protein A2978_03220 [Chlamydiae bacterium RIFCSPLOWO2_01_FULL_44_52]OGN68682.1 MAG: hypothetical protein A3